MDLTLEGEFGHIPLRVVLRESLLIARGMVSQQEATINIVVQ
jgi:hypothetical protein